MPRVRRSLIAAGTTVVEGSAPAMTRIVPPRAASVTTVGTDEFASNTFTAEGNGRYIGFYLRPAGATLRENRRTTLRLRTRTRARRLRLVVETTDAAGNRARRTLGVRR